MGRSRPDSAKVAKAALRAAWEAALKGGGEPEPTLPVGTVFLGRRHGTSEDIPLDPELRTQHLYILGQTGTRKTTLLRNLIAQDLAAGHGLAVLSPDEEMFRDHLLPAIPEERIPDVVYIDPGDAERPVSLNPLHLGPNEDLKEKVTELLPAFLRLVEGQADAAGAVRMRRILRATIRTLTEIPGHTLLDVPRLLHRDAEGTRFRAWAAPQLADKLTQHFWLTEYEHEIAPTAHLAVLNRLDELLIPALRSLLCTPGASFNFREAMDSKKIVLCRVTSKACKGAPNANLIGQIIIAGLKLAALSREDIPEAERKRNIDRYLFPIFIDEFQNFCGLNVDDYELMFSRSRKYVVPLHLAHLQTSDLPERLVQKILGVVSTLVLFRCAHSDASRLCREMVYEASGPAGPELRTLDPKAVVSLPAGRAYCKIPAGASGVPSVILVDMYRKPADGDAAIASRVIAQSRVSYGTQRPRPTVKRDTQQPAEPLDPSEW